MKTYRELLAKTELWNQTKAQQTKALEEIVRKVDNQMDLQFTSEFILNQMREAGFATQVALDIIKAVEMDRAKRTKLGRLIYG